MAKRKKNIPIPGKSKKKIEPKTQLPSSIDEQVDVIIQQLNNTSNLLIEIKKGWKILAAKVQALENKGKRK